MNQSFKIEDDVPLPPHELQHRRGNRSPASAHRASHPSPYPFDDLAPGQSFFVPLGEHHPNFLCWAISGAQRRTGHRLSQRTRIEAGVLGVRIWRLPDDHPDTIETAAHRVEKALDDLREAQDHLRSLLAAPCDH